MLPRPILVIVLFLQKNHSISVVPNISLITYIYKNVAYFFLHLQDSAFTFHLPYT